MILTLFQQVLAVASGGIVGFSLGLIGGGGSILAVPLLLYLVGYRDTHVVIGTTALAVALTAFANLIPHWRAGNVRWKPALAFALPGAAGAVIGAMIGKAFPGKQLLFLFALLMIFVAISMVRPRKGTSTRPVRSGWNMLAWTVPVSFLVGMLSGFFGIGGGFLIVPGLMFATGMPLLSAVGTSLVSVGAFGTTTAITYALSGLVNWLIAIEYIAGGVLGGAVGRTPGYPSRSAEKDAHLHFCWRCLRCRCVYPVCQCKRASPLKQRGSPHFAVWLTGLEKLVA